VVNLSLIFCRKDKTRGSILITSIVILVFLSVLGMNLIVYLLSRSTKTTLELDRLKALYLAEAGIAKSINELKLDQDFDNNGIGNIAESELGGGLFKATHDFQVSNIIGIGEYNDIKRIVQIKYSTL